MCDFGDNGVFWERKCKILFDFGVQWGIFEEQKCDFRVKWGIFQEKMRDVGDDGVFLKR